MKIIDISNMMIGNETLLRLSFFNKGPHHYLLLNSCQNTNHCIGRSSPIFCRACLVAQEQIRHRSDISAAVGTGETIPVERSPSDRPRLSTLPSNRPLGLKYKTKAAVLLSRPPLLTQDLTSFERSFYLYQRRLNERLALPFTRYFYYARGTPGDVEWKRKIKERLTPAREIGQYSGYGEEAWNDEILIGNDLSEPGIQREALLRDAEVEVKGRGEAGEEILKRESLEKLAERITDADRSGDMRSLNRKLERTLYLVVRGKQENDWYLPGHELMKSESLHTVLLCANHAVK